MPGSGKTALGKLLSEKMGYRFIDTDPLIEDKEQLTISEIFEQKGEGYFREKEKEVVKELKNVTGAVIATGGGMPAFFENLSTLKEIGIIIYLRVPLEEIEKRTEGKDNRPLLTSNRRKVLEEIVNLRKCCYEKADIIIDNYMMSKEEICELIVSEIRDL